jgi:hypothetical protein
MFDDGHPPAVVHTVKSWPHLFAALIAGEKRFDLRRDDRGYEVGHFVILNEYDPEAQTYSGRWARVLITYKTSPANPCALSDAGLAPGFCILSYIICDLEV